MYIHKILRNRLLRPFKPDRFEQTKEIVRWYKDGGDKKFRYTYPLNKGSVVVDAGAYHGEWTEGIYNKYLCNIYAFEPVKEYYNLTKNKFDKNNKIRVFQAGLGGKTRKLKIYLDDVGTSVYKKTKKSEYINIVDIKKFCEDHSIDKIDLIKINIEGGEYELLERLINTGVIKKIDYVQVQFHNIFPDAQQRMERLQIKLSKTHKPTYQYWFIWDNWVRKGI